MKLKIHYDVKVTRRHIQAALRGDQRYCAVANAIVESDQDISGANVKARFIQIARHSTERVEKFRTPTAARDFITNFDAGTEVAPFTLRLTEDDFVSEFPRSMRQRERHETVEKRKAVARTTGKKLSDVTPDDVVKYEQGTGTPIQVEEPVKRPTKPRQIKKEYAKRETIAGEFQKQEALAAN